MIVVFPFNERSILDDLVTSSQGLQSIDKQYCFKKINFEDKLEIQF